MTDISLLCSKIFGMKERIVDEKLGVIFLQKRANARQFKFRCMSDGIYITAPMLSTRSDIDRALKSVREKLLALREERGHRLIGPDYKIEAPFFKFGVQLCSGSRITARTEPGKMEVFCPEVTDFTDDKLQQWLRNVIVQAVKKNAARVLPPRLQALAEKHGFSFRSVKINDTLGSWGCCTGTNHIRLSWRLMLLPVHLMDYVLLHELCHTIHKNHGPEFWKALSQIIGRDAKALQSELMGAQIMI